MFRWRDTDDPQADDGLAIDDLTFTAVAGVLGKNLVWNPPSANWNTEASNTNWLDGANASAFAANDNVEFTDAGLAAGATVNIDSNGVTPGAVKVSNSTGTYTFAGGPIGGSAQLIKTGAGTLLLSADNTYTGGTKLGGGVLQVASGGSLGTGSLTFDGPGTLEVAGAMSTTAGIAVNANVTGVIVTNADASFGTYSGAGTLEKRGPGRLALTGALSSTGVTKVSEGTLELAQASGAHGLTFADPVPATTSGSIDIISGIRLNFTGTFSTTTGAVRVLSTGTTIGATAAGTNTIAAPIVVNPNNAGTFNTGFSTNGGPTALELRGPVSGATNVTFGPFSGQGGAGTIIVTAPSTYTGATVINNGYTDQPTGSAGMVRLGVDNALPVGTALTFGVGNGNAGILNLHGFSQTVASLATAGTGNYLGITNMDEESTSTLTITGGESTTYSGPIGKLTASSFMPTTFDNIALHLGPTHTGTLKLTGSSTYAGGTQISGGTLLVSNPVSGSGTGTGLVNIGTGARLGGNGRIAGLVTTSGPALSAGGTIAPGESGPGILTLSGGLDLSTGGTYEWGLGAYSINTPGTDYDQLVVDGGNLNLSGPSRLSIVFDPAVTDPNGGNVFWTTPHSWKVLDFSSSGTATGSFAQLVNGNFGTGNFTLRSGAGADAGDVFLDFQPSVLAVLIWDANGVAAPNPSDGSGTWTDPNQWWNGSANVSFDSTKPDAALFGTGTGGTGAVTVTIPSSVTAASVAFNGNSPVYTISGGILNLQGDATADVVADNTAFISSAVVLGGAQGWVVNGSSALIVSGPISGAHGITKSGTGDLVLSNVNNSFTSLTVTQGDVLASDDRHLGAAGSTVTLDGGAIMTSAPFVSNRAYVLGAAGGTFDTWGGEMTVNGSISGPGSLTMIGMFPLTLTGNNSFNGARVIADGVLAVTSDQALGAPGAGVALEGGGTLSLLNSMTTGRTITLEAGGGAINVPSGAATLSGLIEGGPRLTKTGAGTLALTNNSIPAPRQGITDIAAGTVRIAAVDAANGNTSALGTGDINVLGGGTLELANVNLGLSTGANGGRIFLHNGGTLLGTGNSSYGRSGGALHIVNGTEAAPNVVHLRTGGAGDVLTMKSSLRHQTNAPNSFATIKVGGPGKVVLESGGTTALTGFGGSWELSEGILQLGPVTPGGLGEPLNALGQRNGNVTDINLANPIVITGGILVGATDEKNPASTTNVEPYFRNPVTLAGGAIASSKFKVDANGNPTATPVNANFGGHFTVANGPAGPVTSKVLLYDVVDGAGGRDVNLVGAGNTTWQGTLSVETQPGFGPGSFNINRNGGTVDVVPGAKIIVKSGARLRLNGVNATSDAAGDAVDLELDGGGIALVESGIHRLGNVSGAVGSSATVGAGTTLNANRVRGGSLRVNGTMVLNPNGTVEGTSDVNALTIAGATDAWTGTLDVTNNDVIVRTAGGAARDTAYANALNQAKSGLAEASGNFWSGTGITSSTAAADSGGTRTAVGIILNDFAKAGLPPGPIVNEFGGRPVTENDILMKYTWFGDADLSGVVDGTDYFLIDQAFAAGTLNGGWLNGDFSYDGKVDGTDYFLIDQAFSAQTGPLSTGSSAVPEPSSLLGLLLGAGLLTRLRR